MTDAVLEEQPKPYLYNRTAENLQRVRSHKNHAQKSTALQQALGAQRIAHRVVCALEADLDSAQDADSRREVAIAIRSAIQAWDLACDRVRIAQNRPLPGSLRPEPKPKAKVKAQTKSFVESAPAKSESVVEPPAAS